MAVRLSGGRWLIGALTYGVVIAVAAAGDVRWPLHGLTPGEDHGSPLTQIAPDNVGDLGLAWYVDTSEVFGHEATPIVVDGVIYFTTPWSKVIAVDARTGAKRWTYDPEVPKQYAYWACCDVVNRGLAVHGDRVFVGALDGRLIALKRKDGARLWEVRTVDSKRPYTITGAPRVVGDLVVIGNGGAEYGVRGYVTAYDVRLTRRTERHLLKVETGHQGGCSSSSLAATPHCPRSRRANIALGGASQPLGMPRFSQAIGPDEVKLILEYLRNAARGLP